MNLQKGTLQGRTIALAGLDGDSLLLASSAVDAAGGEWKAFGRATAADQFAGCDAAICAASLVEGAAGSVPIPVLVVGETDLAATHDFILPPLRTEEVVLRLRRILEAKPPTVARPAATPVILAADDDATTTAIVRAVVTQNAMTCHVARDGREAIEKAAELLPSAIVLDVNMPHRDGFEVLQALREDERTASIPVLMLTSLQQEADVMKGFRLGADDYVVKPFNPMELLARIKRLVRMR